MRRIAFLPALLALLGASVFAQTRPATTTPAVTRPATAVVVPDTKIAFVNTEEFADEATGIKKYTNAVKSVQAEFKDRTAELVNIQTRLKTLTDEVAKLSASAAPVGQETIQAKNEEGARLERDLKYKKDSLDADFNRRYTLVVQPISSDIGKALDQYLSSHGLSMILDISKLAPAILTLNPAMDVTKDFIADYNSKHP